MLRTNKEIVNCSLNELVRKIKRKKLLSLKGKIEWVGDLNKMRRSRTRI